MEFFLKKIDTCCCCLGINLRLGTFVTVLYSFILYWIFTSYLIGGLQQHHYSVCQPIVCWFFFIYTVVFQLLPSGAALYGVYKKNSKFLEPYVLLNVVAILTYIPVLILMVVTIAIVNTQPEHSMDEIRSVIYSFSRHSKPPTEDDLEKVILIADIGLIISTLALTLHTCVLYYFTSVVHSYRMQIRDEEDRTKYSGGSRVAPPPYKSYNPLDESKNEQMA